VILRVYKSHNVLGKVTHYCPPNDRDHALWRVRFGDQSDEEEDLDFDELNVALEKYNMNRSSLGKLYNLVMNRKMKNGQVVMVRPRREVIENKNETDVIEKKDKTARSKAEWQALIRRKYCKLDANTSRDEMLKIMEMPHSGWYIESIRRTSSGIMTKDRVDRYFHHQTLFSKPVRLRSITEVKRNILNIQDQFLNTKLIVYFHVTHDSTIRVLTTEQLLNEIEDKNDDVFVSNVRRLVDEIENKPDEDEHDDEEERDVFLSTKSQLSSSTASKKTTNTTTTTTSTNDQIDRPHIKYYELITNILKATGRPMQVKDITKRVIRFHPYFSTRSFQNVNCACRAVLNSRQDLFHKTQVESIKNRFQYGLVGMDYDAEEEEEEEEEEKEEEEEEEEEEDEDEEENKDRTPNVFTEKNNKYLTLLKEVLISSDEQSLTVSQIVDFMLKNYPAVFRNRKRKSAYDALSQQLNKRDDIFERIDNPGQRIRFAIRREMMDQDVVCQKCGKDTQTEKNFIVICGEEKGKNHGCNRGWHAKCLRPMLNKVPKGDWFCKICVKRGTEGLPLPVKISGRMKKNVPGYEVVRPLRLDDDVYVWWKKHKKWYTGSITTMKGNEVSIEYLDGDLQKHSIEELNEDGWRYCFNDIVD